MPRFYLPLRLLPQVEPQPLKAWRTTILSCGKPPKLLWTLS